jgi:hypothetical protein
LSGAAAHANPALLLGVLGLVLVPLTLVAALLITSV